MSDIENPYVFTDEDAVELAKIAQSDRVRDLFVGRRAKLKEILNNARKAYTVEQTTIVQEYFARADYLEVEKFQVGLLQFLRCWRDLPEAVWGEIDELLENDVDANGSLVPDPDFDLKDRRYMSEIDDVLKSLQTAVSRFLKHRRLAITPGRKEETRELKAFVAALRLGWKDNCSEAFGATFGPSETSNGTLVATGAASKLVVAAAQKLDVQWTVSQCQTAMDEANEAGI